MKLASCRDRKTGRTFIAALAGADRFLHLNAALDLAGRETRLPGDMTELLKGGPTMIARAEEALGCAVEQDGAETDGFDRQLFWSRDQLVFLGAVPHPGKIIHTAVNFGSHLSELAKWEAPEWQAHEWGAFHYEHPTGFLQAPSSVTGHESQIHIPRFTRQLDYEVELAIVIGRTAKYVSQEDALDYVVGYCVFNDVSARDIQAREHANKVIMLGKSFDGSCPLGPWLVTADELTDPQDMRMELKVNGEMRQDASTADMRYKIRDLVSWWSNLTLHPGDVITSGSPAGVIAGMKNPIWLKDGDRVDATIAGLGTLTNFIASEP